VDAKSTASETWERLARAGTGLGSAWAVRAEDGRVRYAIAGLALGLFAGSLLGNDYGILPVTGRISTTVHWAGWTVETLSLGGVVAGLCLSVIALLLRAASGRGWESRRRRVSATIRIKADMDPVFREQLKAEPRGTFDREFGSRIPVPDGFEITVLEETPAHWYVVLAPAGTKRRNAWAQREEDGRIDYAIAGFGLGLIAGSLLSIAGDHIGWWYQNGFGLVPFASLGTVVAFALFVIALGPRSMTDKDWAWERRPMTADRYLGTKAGKDPKFREELKAHPRRTFDRELGSRILRPVPDGFEITVLEATATHEYIVL
jgi:hypothetical protein